MFPEMFIRQFEWYFLQKKIIPVFKFQHAFTSSFQKYLSRMYKWIKMQHSCM